MTKLKNYILISTVIGSLIMFVVVYLGVSIGYEKYIVQLTIARGEKMANLSFDSIYQLMKSGSNRQELAAYLVEKQGSFKEMDITVALHYANTTTDRQVLAAMMQGQQVTLREGNVVRYLKPEKVTQECQSCHAGAPEGQVLLVMEVTEDLSPVVSTIWLRNLLYLILISPVPIGGALIISIYLSRRIKSAVEEIHCRIEKVNNMDDLKYIEMNNIDLAFEEFNNMYVAFKQLTAKLREISVDKDILEFEVRLLEKFVITSEVVKDWKEHVEFLLVEINKIMEVQILFSLFKVEDEDYDLEVFWLNTPSTETKNIFEQVIKEELSKTSHFTAGNNQVLNIFHNVSKSQSMMLDLDKESIAFQTKNLILEVPRIGGIVGIGVSSRLNRDSTRELVIESVLTTLLNVIGSVKAIYKYTKELEYFATRDPLTNLYTQRVFWELLDYEVGRAGRHGYKFAALVIDLDDFKTVNDLHGHLFGDKMLQEVAKVFRNALRLDDILARYGGDEYTVILPYADQEQAFSVAQRVMEGLKDLFLTSPNGKAVQISASIGIAVYPDNADDVKNLFLVADNMMYRAKSMGKDRIGLPTSEDVLDIFKTIKDKNILLLKALDENRIIPYFQPIMSTKTGLVEAYEVLMRIDLPERTIAAGEFVEIAESMGIISKLDYMLMEKTLAKVQAENYLGKLFINLSPKALILSDFVPKVRKLVRNYGVDPSNLIFELTERDTVKNLTILEKFVLDLKLEGFKFAVDDFGSGFSSFQYIKRLPIDYVKIEGEFIRAMAKEDGMDRAIVMSIATLARGIGVGTVAEYVEDEHIMTMVKSLGIDFAQGYYVGKPSLELKYLGGEKQ